MMNFKPQHFTVWAEIPVKNLDRSIDFFQSVFLTEMQKCEEGRMPMAFFPTADENGIAGHLYEGKPAENGQGPTIHMACPDKLEDSLERVKKAGGKVTSEIIKIPPGRFAYCTDLDGNSFGIFTEEV